MLSSFVLSAVSALATLAAAQDYIVPGTTGQLGDAAVVTDNPEGVTYRATLPDTPKSGIRGFISGTTAPGGTGVQFVVHFEGFPSPALGPFMYHVHDQPIPPNGNCTAALAHHDPYKRPEKPLCDPSQPQTCQVGDLSGKYGNITGSSYMVSYLDLYESTKPGIGAFFGNRSIVLHTNNATRLTCANFTLVSTATTTYATATKLVTAGQGYYTSPVPTQHSILVNGTLAYTTPTPPGTAAATATATASTSVVPFEGAAANMRVPVAAALVALISALIAVPLL